MSTDQQQQAQENNMDGVWMDKYSTISRVYNYPFVSGSIEKTKEYYNLIKDSNSLVKTTFEYGENGAIAVGSYVGKPILNQLEKYDTIVKKADEFGNTGLDIVEKKAASVKETLETKVNSVKESGSNLIHKIDGAADSVIDYSSNYVPGPVVNLVKYTNDRIDSIIETVLPPVDGSEKEMSENEKFEIEKRMQFLLKLRKRLNRDSIKQLPSNSIHFVTGYGTQSYTSVVEKITELTGRVQSIQMSNQLSGIVDQIYISMDQLVARLGNLTLWFKDINSEALISLGELAKMVKESKNQVLEMADSPEKLDKVKEDSAKILKTCLDLLTKQMEGGKDKLESFKGVVSEYGYFVSAFNVLDASVGKIIDTLNNASKSLESKSK